jgi:hypothetical protein
VEANVAAAADPSLGGISSTTTTTDHHPGAAHHLLRRLEGKVLTGSDSARCHLGGEPHPMHDIVHPPSGWMRNGNSERAPIAARCGRPQLTARP